MTEETAAPAEAPQKSRNPGPCEACGQRRYLRLGDDVIVLKAFIKAQAEFTTAIKNRVNPAFKSKYADLAAVLDAIQPSLFKNEFAITQPHEVSGNVVTVFTILLHGSGAVTEIARTPVNMDKQNAQGLKSAITYGRRIGLDSGLGLKTDEDDDGNGAANETGSGMSESVLMNMIASIEAADTLQALLDVVAKAKKLAGEDQIALSRLKDAYEAAQKKFKVSRK